MKISDIDFSKMLKFEPETGRVLLRDERFLIFRQEAFLSARSARCVILDVTGVELIDTSTVEHLAKVARAAGLLGARCVLTGIRPAVAQVLTSRGVDLGEVTTLRSLKEGLKYGMRLVQERADW